MFNALWLVIALLIALLLLFLWVDWALKHSNQKKSEQPDAKKETVKPTDAKEKAGPETTAATAPTLPAMNIYNSNLADDLDAMLKTEKPQPTRQERDTQTSARGHIADYVANKHYHTFNFDDADATVDTDTPVTFTKEDYKKIVALSNIDDKK